MNMNRSGHTEVREPDWYSRSSDRAKLSPNTLDTESMQNSLTSLNLDSLTVADLDHYSVRSLPVVGSNANNARIATAHDAPWNESPRSLRTAPRSSRGASKPPAGMSALDHLQNSISSLAGSMNNNNNNNYPPVRNIITEENDNDNTEDGGEDNLEGSFGSLRVSDLNEMDATAHAGNVSRTTFRTAASGGAYPPSSPQRSTYYQQQQQYPSSPQRSVYRQPQSGLYPTSPQRSATHRHHHGGYPTSPQRSYGGGNSVTSRNSRYRYGANAVTNNSYDGGCNEPSLSTLGDDDDDNDDDNLEIIKLLSKQVETLKGQLLEQQKQNQILQQHEQQQSKVDNNDHYNNHHHSKSALDKFLPNDSIINPANSSSFHDYSECDSFGEEKEDGSCCDGSHSSKSSMLHETGSPRKALVDSEAAVFGAIAALKASFHKQQKQRDEQQQQQQGTTITTMHTASSSSLLSQPVNILDDEHLLMDELVLCELEAHVKAMQRAVSSQRQSLLAANAKLRAQAEEQAARIAVLENLTKACTATTVSP